MYSRVYSPDLLKNRHKFFQSTRLGSRKRLRFFSTQLRRTKWNCSDCHWKHALDRNLHLCPQNIHQNFGINLDFILWVWLRFHHWISFCFRVYMYVYGMRYSITKYMSSTGIIRNFGRIRAVLWNVLVASTSHANVTVLLFRLSDLITFKQKPLYQPNIL